MKRYVPAVLLCLVLFAAGCTGNPIEAGKTAEDATPPVTTDAVSSTDVITPTSTIAPFETTVDENAGITVLRPADGSTVLLTNKTVTEWLSKPYTLGCGFAYYNGTNRYLPEAVTLKWQSEEKPSSFTVRVTTKRDFSDVTEYEKTSSSLRLKNLLVATLYYWQIVAHFDDRDVHSPVFSFQTAQSPRYLDITGLNNTRDCGGYVTENGRYRVKQNMVLRMAQLDAITKKQADAMLDEFHIRTDLDLRQVGRETSEFVGKASPLGERVKYINVPGVWYKGCFESMQMRQELLVFTDPDNYPIAVHCAGGKDRTGSLCYILGALLGVSDEDLCFDYEATYLSKNAESDGSYLPQFEEFHEMFLALKGETLADKAVTFCHSVGFTDKNIDAIRSILLEKIEP